MCVCVCACVCVCSCVHVHACMCAYLCCVCMHVCMCKYVCMYVCYNLKDCIFTIYSQLEPLQCVSCSPTRPASSASAASSSHTATSSSKTDHDFTLEHYISSMNSLHWENALSDEEEEEKRIEIYKANRRKHYRALLEEQKRLLFGSKEWRIYVSDGPITQS